MSVQEVKEVAPIENADAIEVVTVLGWKVVSKKGEFKVGDKVVYAEIDSLFPKEDARFSFLESVGYRIRTVKMRGQVSQGICFPLSILPEGTYEVGDDVTDLLGVLKYEQVLPNDGEVEMGFPSSIMKTDEERIQTLENRLTAEQGELYVKREKLDGTSTTIAVIEDDNGESKYIVGGRSLMYKEPSETVKGTVYWRVAKNQDIVKKLQEYHERTGRHIAIQGETIGIGVMSNKYKLTTNEFYAFNIFDIDEYRYLSVDEYNELIDELGIQKVWESEPFKLEGTIDDLLKDAEQRSHVCKDTWQEGYVYVKVNPTKSELSTRGQSFKVISNKFLLKFKD